LQNLLDVRAPNRPIRRAVRGHASCSPSAQEDHMFYGLGGVILLILLILVLTGRL